LERGDYGGTPARPVKDWLRESIVLAKLAKTKK
jgi:UDP-3-O-[3-hydroxymyristoyl] glucosamine N-acyltransferase